MRKILSVLCLVLLLSSSLSCDETVKHKYTLIVGLHEGDWQGKNLLIDLEYDTWIHQHFNVFRSYQDFLKPKWKTSRFGEWQQWPEREDMPKGPFCTHGMSLILLRPRLQRHIDELEQKVPVKWD